MWAFYKLSHSLLGFFAFTKYFQTRSRFFHSQCYSPVFSHPLCISPPKPYTNIYCRERLGQRLLPTNSRARTRAHTPNSFTVSGCIRFIATMNPISRMVREGTDVNAVTSLANITNTTS